MFSKTDRNCLTCKYKDCTTECFPCCRCTDGIFEKWKQEEKQSYFDFKHRYIKLKDEFYGGTFLVDKRLVTCLSCSNYYGCCRKHNYKHDDEDIGKRICSEYKFNSFSALRMSIRNRKIWFEEEFFKLQHQCRVDKQINS